MIGILAKLKEICEWWKERYDNLHSLEESLVIRDVEKAVDKAGEL